MRVNVSASYVCCACGCVSMCVDEDTCISVAASTSVKSLKFEFPTKVIQQGISVQISKVFFYVPKVHFLCHFIPTEVVEQLYENRELKLVSFSKTKPRMKIIYSNLRSTPTHISVTNVNELKLNLKLSQATLKTWQPLIYFEIQQYVFENNYSHEHNKNAKENVFLLWVKCDPFIFLRTIR